MKELDKQIKEGAFKNLYLFYGSEKYLIKRYEKRLKESLIPQGMELMNYEVFEEDLAVAEKIIDAASTMPFMCEKRLVEARNTGLFHSGKKEQSERMAEFLKEPTDTTVLLFIEEQIDKRSKLFKLAQSKGYVCEFSPLSEKELMVWVTKLFSKEGISIEAKEASYMLLILGSDMETVLGEAEKLISYKGKNTLITKEDIDLICTKPVETKIFDLVAAIGNKNPQTALDIYNNLINIKQSPIMVLSMIARQFRLILQVKYMEKRNKAQEEIANTLSLKTFAVREYSKQGVNFSESSLLSALEKCLEVDVNIKTGMVDERLSVEMIILRYSC